jgi:hypothetical protein
MTKRSLQSLFIAGTLSAAAIFTGCSDPVTPAPVDYVTEVNDSTGETSLDTIALIGGWPDLPMNRGMDIPHIVRQLEAEQLGSEAISYFESLDVFNSKPLTVLDQIQDDEASQLSGTWCMLSLMELNDEADSIVRTTGAGFGQFANDEIDSMWSFVQLCQPKNEQEALLAYTYIAEYQYAKALDGKKNANPADSEAQEFWHVSTIMNKNHFVSLMRKILAGGLPYTSRFLTPSEFNDAKDDAYEKF